jgi:hypothetical protein
MCKELSRLWVVGFIKEIQDMEWIANPILVPKKNGKWRMCVDNTSLKDLSPLPGID